MYIQYRTFYRTYRTFYCTVPLEKFVMESSAVIFNCSSRQKQNKLSIYLFYGIGTNATKQGTEETEINVHFP